ncbi:hypothetical protein D9M70_488380 [compost metagenome]
MGLVGHLPGGGCKLDELFSLRLVFHTLRNGEHIHFDELAIPDDLEGLLLDVDCILNPPVIGRSEVHLSCCEELRSLGPGGHPHDVRLDAIELLKCPSQSFLAGEDLVDPLSWNAIGNQGPFKVVLRFFEHATLAREALGVEVIGDGARFVAVEALRVVSHNG